jgi:hypothetical protein
MRFWRIFAARLSENGISQDSATVNLVPNKIEN